jgi:hypothetical protein
MLYRQIVTFLIACRKKIFYQEIFKFRYLCALSRFSLIIFFHSFMLRSSLNLSVGGFVKDLLRKYGKSTPFIFFLIGVESKSYSKYLHFQNTAITSSEHVAMEFFFCKYNRGRFYQHFVHGFLVRKF